MSDTTSGGMFAPAGGGTFSDPLTMAFLGMAKGFADSAMPSRLPIPLGAAIGNAAAGFMQGGFGAQKYGLGQEQLRAAQLQNQLLSARMPLFQQAIGQQLGLTGGAPMGVPMGVSAQNGALGVTAETAGGNSPYLTGPQLASMAQTNSLLGLDRSGAEMWRLYGSLPTPGYTWTQTGGVAPLANGPADPRMIAARSAAEAGGNALYREPPKVTVPDGKGGFMEMTIPTMGLPAFNSGAASSQPGTATGAMPSGTANPVSAALGSIPTSENRLRAINAALAAGLPVQAWPAWISAVHNESGWNMGAADGAAGEIGPGQVLPTTGVLMGYTPQQLRDPQTNLVASARYFGMQWQKANGNPAGAFAGYNTGSVTGQNPKRPSYVPDAMARLQQWGAAAPQSSGPSLPAGAIPGKPVLTPQQQAGLEVQTEERKKIAAGYGDEAAKIVAAGNAAPTNLQRLDILENAASNFRPGATGEMRLEGARLFADGLQSLGITPPEWVTKGAAAGETIGKEGGYLAAAMTRALGSREAAVVFNQIRSIQPNVEMSQGGFQVIVNSLRQGIMRDQDLFRFQEQWLRAHPTTAGMQQAFDQAFPVEAYASRVLPYPVPKDPAQLKPNTVYRGPNGVGLWDGKQFQIVSY